MVDTIPIRRALRPGRADGTSERGVYVACWVDDDTGRHWVQVVGACAQDVRDLLEPYIGNNTLTVEGPFRRLAS